MFALLPVLAMAQTKTYSPNDGSFYTKYKSNLSGTSKVETGFSTPFLSNGKWSLSGNVAYVQGVENFWNDNSFLGALSVGYKVDKTFSAYVKETTFFNTNFQGEVGVRAGLWRTNSYAVSANAGYLFSQNGTGQPNYCGKCPPYGSENLPKWTVGVTVSFPVKSIFK
jgi:hypothetical protein